MKKKFLPVVTIFLIISLHFTYAQEKLWQVDLGGGNLTKIGWIKQSNNGYIITSGSNGLSALDNNTGETMWNNKDLVGVSKASFQNIDGLPLFIAEYTPLGSRKRGVIINAANGAVLYNTKEGEYSFKKYHLMIDQGFILFELASSEDRSLMKFSLKTWESEWFASIGSAKGISEKISNVQGFGFVQHGPIITKDNTQLIIGLKVQTISFDLNTGQQLWNNIADKRMRALVYSDRNNSLYLGVKGSKKLTVLDPKTGNDITPGKLKLKGTLVDITEDANGNLVLVETEGFNLIKPETGELIWKKSYKIEYLDEVIPFEDGYIAIGKDEKNGSISVVDKNGKKVWDSKVKGYAYYITPTESGVLYISTERSNILSYADGKDLWKKDVKFKSIPAVTFDDTENKVILFENKKGYKFDLETGSIQLFAEDIELLEVKKKTPLVAEYVSTGYFITADQYASVLTPEGKVLYTKYFKPVSTTDYTQLAKIGLNMAGIDFDLEGAMENLDELKTITNRNVDDTDAIEETSAVVGVYVGTGAGAMMPIFEVTNTRYFNSKSTKDFKFILAKKETTETEGRNFVYMINKATGEIIKKIELLDKTPNYIIDDIDSRVFINEKNKIISAIQF